MFCICIMRVIRKLIISFILPSFRRCQVSLFQVVVVPISRLEFWIHLISNSFGHFGIFVRVSCIWLGFYTLKKLDHSLLLIFTIINFVLLFDFFSWIDVLYIFFLFIANDVQSSKIILNLKRRITSQFLSIVFLHTSWNKL
jgi:hypothetical protein